MSKETKTQREDKAWRRQVQDLVLSMAPLTRLLQNKKTKTKRDFAFLTAFLQTKGETRR